MKVYTGPYHSWTGPYQIADWLQYVGISEDTCHSIGTWLSGSDGKPSLLLKLCNWIESKRKRTIKVRIDNYDTWNMDSTLAIIILPMLKQLRDTKNGSPGSMPSFLQTSNSNTQQCFDFYSEGDTTAFKQGQAEWDSILNEVIWTFEQLQPDCEWENQYWITHPEMDLTEYAEDEGKTSIPLRWKVEGECDWVGREQHANRIQTGLVLFGSHYQNLWD